MAKGKTPESEFSLRPEVIGGKPSPELEAFLESIREEQRRTGILFSRFSPGVYRLEIQGSPLPRSYVTSQKNVCRLYFSRSFRMGTHLLGYTPGKPLEEYTVGPVEEYSRKAKFDGKELDLFLTEPEVIAFIRASNLQDDSRRVDSHKEPLLVGILDRITEGISFGHK